VRKYTSTAKTPSWHGRHNFIFYISSILPCGFYLFPQMRKAGEQLQCSIFKCDTQVQNYVVWSTMLTGACNWWRAKVETLHQWVQSAATGGMWLLVCNVKIPQNTMWNKMWKRNICHSKNKWLKQGCRINGITGLIVVVVVKMSVGIIPNVIWHYLIHADVLIRELSFFHIAPVNKKSVPVP
jgi:hypothetical protein